MAQTMKELGIDKMSVEDRIALVQEIWDSVAADVERSPISEAQTERNWNEGTRLTALPAQMR